MGIIVVIVLVAGGVYLLRGRKPETTYEAYKRDYDAYMREKKRKNKPRRSIFLLLSFLLGLIYLLYYILTAYGGMDLSGSQAEQLGTLMAGAVFLPHAILVFLAVVFGFLGFLVRGRACALISGILYITSIILMPICFLYVLAEMILAFVAYVRMAPKA